MYDKLLCSSFGYYRDTLRHYNNLVKQVSPKEYGMILQGNRKKRKRK